MGIKLPFTTFYWVIVKDLIFVGTQVLSFSKMKDELMEFFEFLIYPWRGQQKYGAPMPDNKKPATFDPTFGYEERKPKDPPNTTPEEMRNARVPLEFRDYCVDHYINWVQCKKNYFPTTWKCQEDFHHWNSCIYEEKMDRYREFERERR